MKTDKSFTMIVFAVLLFTGVQMNAIGQVANKIANEVATASGVRFDTAVAHSGGTLTVSAADGRIFRKEIRAGGSAEFQLVDNQGERLPDGTYTYELRLTPALNLSAKDVSAARAMDDAPEAERAGRKRVEPGMVQSGSFAILNGQVIVAGSLEEPRRVDKTIDQPRGSGATMSGNTVKRLLNHRFSLGMMPDQVIADDLIVQGSTCVGLDCVNNESFSFDTIRLKENNTRISFNDTSTSAGFPTNDWTIRANSSSSGGGSFLAFVDRGASENGDESGTIVFEVDAGAPANALRVSSAGKVGIRTATPVLDVHVTSTDTPAIRQEQTNGGGFTAQTWDIGANEANWFVRDVTGGSRLPLRIRPGAPTSSIDISASGNVGIGTASPSVKLQVTGDGGEQMRVTGPLNPYLTVTDTGGVTAIVQAADAAHSVLVGAYTNHLLSFVTNYVERMQISVAGNVGIGTVPDQKLTVNGDADKIGGGSWLSFSDERLKNIKGSFSSGLSAVMRLQPIRYQYKPDNALGLKSDGDHIGFGAQSLQKVIPEAVTRNSEGYLMVNNDPILWTMLNAIKEQQKEIEQLKGQIRKLQTSRHRHSSR